MDVFIATLFYAREICTYGNSNDNSKISFKLDSLEEYLSGKNYTEQQINIALSFVEKYFFHITGEDEYIINSSDYIRLIEYESLSVARRSLKNSNISIIIAIVSILLTLLALLLNIIPNIETIKDFFLPPIPPVP